MGARMTQAQFDALQGREDRPKKRRKAKPKAGGSEADLLRQVLYWLKLKGVFHWRANSGGGLRRGKGGKTVPVKANPSGTPDVIAMLPLSPRGTLVMALELKSPAGKLRESQKAWRDRAEAAGVIYLVVRSMDELIEAFAKEGVR